MTPPRRLSLAISIPTLRIGETLSGQGGLTVDLLPILPICYDIAAVDCVLVVPPQEFAKYLR